jgi:hypothetical protein
VQAIVGVALAVGLMGRHGGLQQELGESVISNSDRGTGSGRGAAASPVAALSVGGIRTVRPRAARPVTRAAARPAPTASLT